MYCGGNVMYFDVLWGTLLYCDVLWGTVMYCGGTVCGVL